MTNQEKFKALIRQGGRGFVAWMVRKSGKSRTHFDQKLSGRREVYDYDLWAVQTALNIWTYRAVGEVAT